MNDQEVDGNTLKFLFVTSLAGEGCVQWWAFVTCKMVSFE